MIFHTLAAHGSKRVRIGGAPIADNPASLRAETEARQMLREAGMASDDDEWLVRAQREWNVL